MIRVATKEDYELVKDFTSKLIQDSPYQKMFEGYVLTEEMFNQYISNPNNKLCLISEVDGKPVGFAAFDLIPWLYHDAPVNIARFVYIYINPDNRGKGLGKELNQAFEYWGKIVGATWYSKGNSGKNEGYTKTEVVYMKEVK